MDLNQDRQKKPNRRKESVDILYWADINPNKRGSFEDFVIRLAEMSTLQNVKVKFVFGKEVIEDFDKSNVDYISVNNIISFATLRSVIEKINVNIIHFRFISHASNVVRYAKSAGINKIVYGEHLSPAYEKKQKQYKVIEYIKKTRRSLYFSKVDTIVAVSDFIAMFLRKKNWIQSGKIKTIYNGINLERFHPFPNDYMKQECKKSLLGAKESDLIITYAGSFIEAKGVRIYIQSVKMLLAKYDSLFFVFVGQGPLYDEIVNDIPSRERSRVKFLGRRNDMQDIFRVSDIVVVPSIWMEAFGFVAAEAQASGVPVVGSNIGGLPEVVLDGQTGILTPPGDLCALSKALEQLINDMDMRKCMGIQGRKHVEKNFDLSKQVAELLTFYKSLM